MTIRAQLYLRCIDDWKATFEVVALLGDTPPARARDVWRVLTGLEHDGLAEYHDGNGTFRITESGRALLASNAKGE